jgi:predicted metal-dependent hydrolase
VIGSLVYGDETIRYEVQFLASRRTLGIEVHPDSRVLVRAPLNCSEDVIAERVLKRAGWISRQLVAFERYRPRTPVRHYVNGESHLYLGRHYRLKVRQGECNLVKLARGQLVVTAHGSRGPAQIKTLLHRWYLDRAHAVFGEVLETSLRRFKDVGRPRLIVRSMKSRWGSLSRAGTMTLNLNLVRAPRACIEYVITHELCHTQYRDHDARFFKLLGRLMPDWQQRKERLEAALL